MDQPYHSSDYYGRYLLSQRAWTPQEKLAELVCECASCWCGKCLTNLALLVLSPDDVQAHIPQLLARVHIETLVHGNVSKDVSLVFLIGIWDLLTLFL